MVLVSGMIISELQFCTVAWGKATIGRGIGHLVVHRQQQNT